MHDAESLDHYRQFQNVLSGRAVDVISAPNDSFHHVRKEWPSYFVIPIVNRVAQLDKRVCSLGFESGAVHPENGYRMQMTFPTVSMQLKLNL